MKLAVISDIHGNLSALQAVLADIDKEGVDLIINAGDTLSGPLASALTADLLMQRQIRMIAGNHERQVLTLPLEKMNPSDACTAREISAAHRAWLATAPVTMWVGDEVFVCHGTPASDVHYWLETVTDDDGQNGSAGVRAASQAEVTERLGTGLHADKASLILCGHTHVPRVASVLAPGGMHIDLVNPGSVGLPAYRDEHPFVHRVESGSPHARYAVVQKMPDGWRADLRCVPYNAEAMVQRALKHGRADWAYALQTGYMLPA